MPPDSAEQHSKPDLTQRIAGFTHRTMVWGRDHVPPGIRSIIGALFCVGGVLGFLPILGFWMLPLGVAFIALDVPPARHKIDAWIDRLWLRSKGIKKHGPQGPVDKIPSKHHSD